MSFDCRNNVALISGASSGIGKALAVGFGKRGAKVALTGRNIQNLNETNQQIQDDGGFSGTFPFDLDNINEIPRLVADIRDYFNDPVTLLVNNAGINIAGLVEDSPLEAYSSCLQTNFMAPLSLIKNIIDGMKEKGYGQIINISSGCGKRALPFASAYSASKSALNALTESLRIELAPHSIEVLLFSPGPVDTEIFNRTRYYGNVKPFYRKDQLSSPEIVAEKIIKASYNSKREVSLSFFSNMVYHLNYWFPGLLDKKLTRSLIKN